MQAPPNPVLNTYEFVLPGDRRLKIGPRPAIMGILNITPDSFSDGGSYPRSEDAVETGLAMVRAGADVLDVGGESTRPGSRPVPTAQQLDRVLPVIRGLRGASGVPISVDTADPRVGEAALEAGADIVNDVSACRDPNWVPVLKSRDVPVILMHMRGSPRDMQQRTDYPEGVLTDIQETLVGRMDALSSAGVSRERFILDPGIGFAKELHHNLQILNGLSALRAMGRPLLIGASRKSFLGTILRGGPGNESSRPPRDRDVGSVAANVIALLHGASILRVHNVPYTRDLVDVFEAVYLQTDSKPAEIEAG